ncbi:MAG: hypothetical protein L0387_07185 [Acidobacteria bacterium]|nr:hypothetical protein [Acidobacteriota bacterium]MCI0621439.1 hypothetical protein [Acidobacteriota bacterium]MCI0722444.1 hypothetical protein [Acidobacteriota bacterium]
MSKEVRDLVYQKVNESVAQNPLFAEAQGSPSKRFPRRVQFTEDLIVPAVGIELAEDAEALADEEGISYGEALTRVREHHQALALEKNPPRTYKVGEVTFTEDPRHPVDLESVERANRAEAVSQERGVSYGDALGVVREAEQVAKSRNLSFAEALRMV